MNCRPGEVARTVQIEDAERFVVCLKFIGKPFFTRHRDCWLLDHPITWYGVGGITRQLPYCPDRFLRPLRDSGGRDETLVYIGAPEEVAA